MSTSKFNGKNILVTGANGFIGRHLVVRLSQLGAHVYGISLRASFPQISKVDICDYKKIDQFIRDKKIEICYHLAGESIVESGKNEPYSTFRVNIDGTLNILEIGRKRSFERIIIASSSHVYGKNEVPYLENYTPKPTRPYETSKACTDLIAQSYADTYKLPVLIPRFVNIYGPGDLNFTRLIPKTMMQIITKNEVELWGGNAIRDFLYIDDAINGYLDLVNVDIATIEENRIFNFGGGNTITVNNLVQKIIKISRRTVALVKTDEIREDEIKSQYVSFAKAKKLLKWKPTFSLNDGLGRALEWYEDYFAKGN